MTLRLFRCMFALMLVVSATAFAQETRGTIVGHVLDEQGGAMPGVERHDYQRRYERLGDAHDELDGLLPGSAPAARQLSGVCRTAGFQDVGTQRHDSVGCPAVDRGPDTRRGRRQRNRDGQRRGADSRDGRADDRAEPRSSQRREPADVLEHARAVDAIRDRRQLVGRRALCRAGFRQPHVERHVGAWRRGRERMDDRRRDEQRQRSPPRLVAELRHDRGSAHRDGELRRVLRPWDRASASR